MHEKFYARYSRRHHNTRVDRISFDRYHSFLQGFASFMPKGSIFKSVSSKHNQTCLDYSSMRLCSSGIIWSLRVIPMTCIDTCFKYVHTIWRFNRSQAVVAVPSLERLVFVPVSKSNFYLNIAPDLFAPWNVWKAEQSRHIDSPK